MNKTLAGALMLWAITLPGLARAERVPVIDPTRQADVNNRSVPMKDLNLGTISQPIRSTPVVSDSYKKADRRDAQFRDVNLNTVTHSTVPVTVLPQQNFGAKRATESDRVRREKELDKPTAKIRDRQIRPFTTSGEQELKDQLNPSR